MEKLKPCPFCGAEPYTEYSGGFHWIECEGCGCSSAAFDNSEGAITAWNTRALCPDTIERCATELDTGAHIMSHHGSDLEVQCYQNAARAIRALWETEE